MGQKDDTRTDRWIANAMGWNDRILHGFGGSNVFYEGDRLYSYGRHFELGRVLRTSKGEPRGVILNGDRYSATTTTHQNAARGAARRSGLQTLIVPFTALNAAGIAVSDIEPIHVREDRNERLYHSAPEVHGDHLMMDDPTGATVPYERQVWERNHPDADANGYHTEVDQRPKQVPDYARKRVRKNGWLTAEWNEESETWCWETTRHWLGDSLFRARSNGRRRLFLSSFDYQEARPLYFLCEMPRTSDACSVEQAYEDLKPKHVHDAEAAGLEPTRQGDMFAVPTELSTREVKLLTPHRKGRIVRRPKSGLLNTNHTASEVLYCTKGRTYARGVLYHEPQDWRPPDHARRRMGDGKTWHLLMKNTVPHTRQRTREAV